MKKILNFESKEVANIFDEVTLWSAPFGRLLLENIPMTPKTKIVDIGFGTGFPLIELSQRFGDKSKIYGIEIWKEGINKAKEKIKTLEIRNVEIIEESASNIDIGNSQIDLVTSNLGVNNFEEKEKVYFEIKRILKRGGRLSITTNPIGTFKELFEMFNSIFKEMNLEEEQLKLKKYVEHRGTKEIIVSELKKFDMKLVKSKTDSTNIRFIEAEAMLNHVLIRVGFRESWSKMVREESRSNFIERLIRQINDHIKSKGEFIMTIPMLYLEFEKE